MFSICSEIITRLKSIFHKTANPQWRHHVGWTRLNQPEYSPRIPWFDIEIYTSWGHPFELLSTGHTGEHGGRFLDQNTKVEWRLQCPWLANITTLCPQHGQKIGVWSDDYVVATPSKEFHSFGDLLILTSTLMSNDLPAKWCECHLFQTQPFVCTCLGRISGHNLGPLRGNQLTNHHHCNHRL